MWLFLPGGLLMPATFPRDLVDKNFVPEGSPFDIQIRARVKSHLENFLRDYVRPMGYDHSEIQATPEMDYNFRFYMRHTEFAAAIACAVLDIDYEKFKPTAEDKDEDGRPLYADGKEYHAVLNAIWGTVTRLGSPGGVWGSYTPGSSHWASPTGWGGRDYSNPQTTETLPRPGETYTEFLDRKFPRRPRADDRTEALIDREAQDWKSHWLDEEFEGDDDLADASRGSLDWRDSAAATLDIPEDLYLTGRDYAILIRSEDSEVQRIVSAMDRLRLSIEEWVDFLTPEEWGTIQAELQRHPLRKSRGRRKKDRRRKKSRA